MASSDTRTENAAEKSGSGRISGVALLVASWFHMPGGLFLLVILGYGTMLMLHIPVTERVFNPYLID